MARSKAEAGGEKVNKRKLVSEALDALGASAGPNDLIRHIKDTHGHELDYALVASYKSSLNKGKGGGGTRGGRGGGAGGNVDMKDVLAVRELITRLGESNLQQLIKALR